VKYGRPAILVLALIALGAVVAQLKTPTAAAAAASSPLAKNFALVDKAGNIAKPAGYRDTYETLGTYFVLDPAGNQMHVTYASPGAAAYFRENGKFADGTVLVKEVFGTEHAQMTTGDVHRASGTKVWFVMIKDDKGRYTDSKLWGDGWGWALYNSDAPDKQVAVSYKKDCQGCHIPARKTGWVYTEGYPVLHSSK
jgi:hypothetical protein